jgi:pimeloyl-ACP methyl ester carboxylesterase
MDHDLDQHITLDDGRVIGFADYGKAGDEVVFVCHGSPGSRRQPHSQAASAREKGYRIIALDRPGYGLSSPLPGRSIAQASADILAVAGYLNIERFMVVGASTGGAYALALAAQAPKRVSGVLLCCAMTDMRWANIHAPMPACAPIWQAQSRAEALATASNIWGDDGSKMHDFLDPKVPWPAADLAFITDPALAPFLPDHEVLRQGMQGIVDDRLADGPTIGWRSFDVNQIHCPVMIIHGQQDTQVPVAHAHHITSLLPDAQLKIFAKDGHLSINARILTALDNLAKKVLIPA